MTSIPASDINNARFSVGRAHEFGYLRRANTLLLAALGATVLALSAVVWQVAGLRHTIADFRPAYVRINDVGKAEVVYYKDAKYVPQSPEVIRTLSDFTSDFFSRMKGRTDPYWHSKYLLSQTLMQRTYQDDQRTKWMDAVERGAGLQNDVVVKRVTLVNLTPKGGIAYVDFTRNYYEDGITQTRKETDTVTYYFSFLPKVDGQMLQYNPLGIVITDYNVQEDFK